jgi:RNA polymerase sigma factor (sigma-70 family)
VRLRGSAVVSRGEIVAWVGERILPHEADVRRFIARTMRSGEDIDDVVHEAYCRLAGLDEVAHIANPRAYFFQVARSVVLERIRRTRIVRIDAVAEIDALNIVDDEPSPERNVAARRELDRVRRLIEGLPAKCRRVFELRKIEGLSQKAIAAKLGVSENTVEAQAARGLKLILKALAAEDANPSSAATVKNHERNRKHD